MPFSNISILSLRSPILTCSIFCSALSFVISSLTALRLRDSFLWARTRARCYDTAFVCVCGAVRFFFCVGIFMRTDNDSVFFSVVFSVVVCLTLRTPSSRTRLYRVSGLHSASRPAMQATYQRASRNGSLGGGSVLVVAEIAVVDPGLDWAGALESVLVACLCLLSGPVVWVW